MPTYRVTDPDTGKVIKLTGDSPPTEEELNEIFSKFKGKVETAQIEKPTIGQKREYGEVVKGLTLEQREKEKGLLTELGEKPLVKTVKGVSAGLGMGGTLGLAGFIPPLKKEAAISKEEAPLAYGAGEIGSYAIPIGAPAKVFKGTGKLAAKIIPKAPKFIKTAAGAGVAGAVTEGVKEFVETGDIVEAGKTAAIAGVAEAITAGTMDLLSPLLKKAAGNFYKGIIKPKVKATAKGFKADNIVDYNLEGFNLGQTKNKARTIIDTAKKNSDELMEKFLKNNPEHRMEIDDIFIQAIEDIDNSRVNTILVDEEAAAIKYIDDLFDTFSKKNLTGKIDAKQFRKIKSQIAKRAFAKTREMTTDDRVKSRAAKELWVGLVQKLDNAVDGLSVENKKMADLLPVEDAIEDAIERIGKNKTVSMADWLIVSGGIAGTGGGATSPAVAGGVLVGKRAIAGGRGAALTSLAGKGMGTEVAKRTTAMMVGAKTGRLRLKEEEELGKSRITGRRGR